MKENNKIQKSYKTVLLKLGIIIVIIGVVIIAAMIIFRGDRKTTGAFPNNIYTQSLICSSPNVHYGIIDSGAYKESATVAMVFKGISELSTISFDLSLSFSDNQKAADNEAKVHYLFAEKLLDAGLSFTEFDNTVTTKGDEVVISLYSTGKNLNSQKEPFFMLDKADENLTTINLYKLYYEGIGFTCNQAN